MITQIRSLGFFLWFILTLGFWGLVCLPTMLMPAKSAILGARLWAKSTRFGLRWICNIKTEIRGEEYTPTGACLIASKHQSTFDILMPFIYAENPAFVLKRELFFYPILGWYGWKSGMIPIDRGGYVKTLKKMLARAKTESENGRQILIFPEGTRQELGATPDYKSGVYAMYKELNTVCNPVALLTGHVWPRKSFLRKPGTIIIEFLPPIEAGLPRKEFMARLENAIEPACNKLLEEIDFKFPEIASQPEAVTS